MSSMLLSMSLSRRKLTAISTVIIVMLTVCSCSSLTHTSKGALVKRKTTTSTTVQKKPYVSQHISPPSHLPQPSRALLSEANKWLGTPYQWGGNDRNGVDCSGFVLKVYLNALGIKLPRTSATQHKYCSSIPKNSLQPGDLVFFATNKNHDGVSHVGMYIGDGKMVHASSSRGVIVSALDETYYTRTYFGAGRVERYYAMLDKNPVVKTNDKRQSKPSIQNDNTVATSTSTIRYEKATSLPKRKKPETTDAPSTNAGGDLVASTSGNPIHSSVGSSIPSKNISTDDARAMVLDNIIEQKVDSIFTTSRNVPEP